MRRIVHEIMVGRLSAYKELYYEGTALAGVELLGMCVGLLGKWG
jgi:hypothetical protein